MVKQRTLRISSLALKEGSGAAAGIAIDRDEDLVVVVNGRKNSFVYFGTLPRRNRVVQCSNKC